MTPVISLISFNVRPLLRSQLATSGCTSTTAAGFNSWDGRYGMFETSKQYVYSVAWGKGPTKNLMTLVCCHLINPSKQVVYPCPSHRNVWPQLSDSRSPTQQQLQPLIWKTFRTRKSCKGLKWTWQCTWKAVSEEPKKTCFMIAMMSEWVSPRTHEHHEFTP